MLPDFLADLDGRKTVVVVGAGAAGIAAAIAAERQGAQVLLVEKTGSLGGTVTHSLIHTIGGLYDVDCNLINGGLPAELVDRLSQQSPHALQRKIGRTWTLSVAPEIYENVVEGWLSEHKRLHVLRNATVCAVSVTESSVQNVKLMVNGETVTLRPLALVDTTGTAEVVRMVSSSLVDDGQPAAAGFIFTLRGVDTRILDFPQKVGLQQMIREAAEAGEIPADCGKAWLDLGVYEEEAYIKLCIPLGPDWREPNVLHAAEQRAIEMRDVLVPFLAEHPAFANAKVVRTGTLGIREGGRVKGEYCLTESDVRNARRFDDAVGRCCWPIEFWDPEKGVTLEYLPEGEYYEIPLRALKVSKISNLWMAGKCLSAEPLAQASVRVVGACWSMGEGVGKAAADHRPSS
jgi:hypothetical protein